LQVTLLGQIPCPGSRYAVDGFHKLLVSLVGAAFRVLWRVDLILQRERLMSIRPLPTLYTCPACGWSKTITPRSDALMPGDLPRVCPACGHASLASRQASSSSVQQALGDFTQQIKRLFQR